MVLPKKRDYNEHPTTNLSSLYAPPVSPVNVFHKLNPWVSRAVFLRAHVQFYMQVQVGTVDAPPEAWWPNTTVTLLAFYASSGTSTVGNSVGTSEHYLGSQLLVPRLTPSPTAPDEYTIQWSQTEPMVLQTAREDATDANSSFNVGIVVFDPYAALDGTYTSIAIGYDCRAWTLWGQLP